MVFITTGQRIATENFADGVIYKVTFVDTTISYMMCVGIGQDFVMLQGPNPSLFCLTMSSASRVSTIDIHDPTPPEPPTPIENALQYQTGEPPFTFTTTESSLFSWYIEGPCGVKTANLFNKDGTWVKRSQNDSVVIDGDDIIITTTLFCYTSADVKANTDYIISCTSSGGIARNIAVYKSTTFTTENLIASLGATGGTFNTSSATKIYILFYASNNTQSSTATYSKVMMNEGTTALPYDEYNKYKISILSNDNAETIYLDEALAEGERLYSVNIDNVVVTDIGENTLSVTPTPPEMQIVYGIYAEA